MFKTIFARFIVPVALASVVVAYFGLPYIDRLLAEWFRSDLELRAQLVMQSMDEPVAELIERKDRARLKSYLAKMTFDQRLLAIQICKPDGTLIMQTERMPVVLTCDVTPDGDGPHRPRLLRLRLRDRRLPTYRAPSATALRGSCSRASRPSRRSASVVLRRGGEGLDQHQHATRT